MAKHSSHDHDGEDAGTVVVKGDVRGSRSFILGALSGGHGIFHWYFQSFLVALPQIKQSLLLSNTQIGTLVFVREIVSGLINLPGGVLTDMFRSHWGIIMAACLGVLGLGHVAMGFVPNMSVFLIVMAVVAIPQALWHLPAMAALSRHFAQRRGFALGAHNMGGGIGDLGGPLLTGVLLGATFWPGEAWRGLLVLYGIPSILFGLLAWWAFKPLGGEYRGDAVSFKTQLRIARNLMRNPLLLAMTVVSGIRSMGHIGFITFLSIFLAEEAGMTVFWIGFHVALITALGIVAAPIMGAISDRKNRKFVLLPGFVIEGVLILLLINAGTGLALSVIIALLGIFIFSLQPIIMAGAMDAIGDGGEATSLGFLFTFNFILAAASPLIAGSLYDNLGITSVFLYVTGLFFLAAVIVVFIPMRAPLGSSSQGRHRH